MTSSGTDNDVILVSGALDPGDLFVRSMKGREAISQLYEFEFVVQTDTAFDDDQLDALFAKPAYMAFGAEVPNKVSGVFRAIEMQSAAEVTPVVYRMIMVPQLWYATQTFRSKVFQDKTVADIVKDVLTDLGMASGTHFDIQATAKHPKREFTVQYQETDYAFISRLLEYEGMYFFFDQGDDGEKIVFADGNDVFVELPDYATIAYRPTVGTTDEHDSIQSFARERRSIPATVALRDYNYRTPSLSLAVDTPVDKKGKGTQIYYGDHYKDVADGKRLVKIRSEEILVRKERYAATSRVRGLHPGHKFALEEHPIDGIAQAYYVCEIEHSAVQTGARSGSDGTTANDGYSNRFVALPMTAVFRPQRVTPLPKIPGVMHAQIDSSTSGTAAPIDDHGRYKVLLPYDTAGKAGGKASRWMRMAQHYSGPGYGSHFPLHAGTEVILVHLDGDPDRPIIAAAVPNPNMTTPVVAGNATQSVIRSHAGIHIEMEDDA